MLYYFMHFHPLLKKKDSMNDSEFVYPFYVKSVLATKNQKITDPSLPLCLIPYLDPIYSS